MKIEHFFLAKYPDTNEDIWRYTDEKSPIVLCDGASESYDSRRWAETLCHGYNGDFSTTWLNNMVSEYESKQNTENMSWSQYNAYQRGSFSTFLSLEFDNGKCFINAVGDTTAFALDSKEILDQYPYFLKEDFLAKPYLLSTKKNSFYDSELVKVSYELRYIDRATHILMLTDAIALWLTQERDNPESIKRLVEMSSNEDFGLFVEQERMAKRMRLDDTTMIRISLKRD